MRTFNPILVWFYLEAIWKEIAEIKTLSIPFWSDFIWLRCIECITKRKLLSIPFWSDFILSRRTADAVGMGFQLSIPFWSDFIEHNHESIEILSVIFQSHFGLILSYTGAFIETNEHSLSIPFWSDFIVIRIFNLPSVQTPFNPILVWFYRA